MVDPRISRFLSARAFGVVGASADRDKYGNKVLRCYLQHGHRAVPVNPRAAGSEILGEQVYASLAEVPGPVDMVDVFRSSAEAGPIAEQAAALAVEKGIKVLWMQLGVRNDAAAETAEAAGLQVVMDRCPKIEFGRLNTELSWGGFNSRVISAKRRKVRIG